jgi:hypothetical protein
VYNLSDFAFLLVTVRTFTSQGSITRSLGNVRKQHNTGLHILSDNIRVYKNCIFYLQRIYTVPVTVAERSKASTVFARSEAGIVGSNSTQGMDVWCMCLFCVCVVLCLGKGLATSWSLVQGVLPTVDKIKKLKWNGVSRMSYAPDGATGIYIL